jgi:sec-independent protein translocase protein TatB
MFDIGGGELLVIGIVALVVIGPKELPGLLRTAGNAMGKVRRMAAEFRGQFDEAMREAELDQAKKAFTDVNDAAQSATTSFNPLDTIRNEIKAVKDEIKGAQTGAAAPLPDPKIDLPPEAPPVNIMAQAPAPPVVEEPAAKPKRTRKKAADETPGSAA